jgi:hypothetical protein
MGKNLLLACKPVPFDRLTVRPTLLERERL